MVSKKWLFGFLVAGVFSTGFLISCQPTEINTDYQIRIDGSSTVYPITEASLTAYQDSYSNLNYSHSISGTSGGFQALCRGELELANASRPITELEKAECSKNGVEYLEIPVGTDGIAVVANAENYWLDYLTVSELRMIWALEHEGLVQKWSDIREDWPDEKIKLFGPSSASGTYDYFADAVLQSGTTRGDFTASENDKMLAQGIANNRYALGFFGFTFLRENYFSLKLVPINDLNEDNGEGPITPSEASLKSGSYAPLSRPLFLYVRKEALKKRELLDFLEYYLIHAAENVSTVGNIPLSEQVYRQYLSSINQYKQELPN